MSAPTTVSDCKDKLRNLEQGMTETVQSFNSRFRQQLNELNYAIQNEDRTPIERRVAIDMEEREALKTYLLSLRPEISQMVIASDPKTLNLAQQVAANKERWLRELGRVAHRRNQSRNQSNNTPSVPKRNVPNLQPREFGQLSDDRMKLKCSKCSRIGHTSEMCYSRHFPLGNRGKIPPRVYQTAESPKEIFQESIVPPPEVYYQSCCDEKTEGEPDLSLIPEQE
jgi:hypothetical protein